MPEGLPSPRDFNCGEYGIRTRFFVFVKMRESNATFRGAAAWMQAACRGELSSPRRITHPFCPNLSETARCSALGYGCGDD